MPYKDIETKLFYNREYKRNRLKIDQQYRIKNRLSFSNWNRKRRNKLICLLGGQCICCGEKDIDVLTFDHINNDGNTDRKTSRKLKLGYYINNIEEFKYKIQLLCMNCNYKKSLYFSEFNRLERNNQIAF